MGGIDLDPASCDQANQRVKASRYYTKEENGLAQSWFGRVWCNPPYGRVNPIPGAVKSYQKLFVERGIAEYQAGNIEQIIMLILGNACFNKYFYPLWDHAICFHDGTLTFTLPDGSPRDFGFGSIFVYMGPNEQKFVDTFGQFGRMVKAIAPASRPASLALWGNV
jgi:hypothetical protein